MRARSNIMAREIAIEVMRLYYQAKEKHLYRFPAELHAGIGRKVGCSASMVEACLIANIGRAF